MLIKKIIMTALSFILLILNFSNIPPASQITQSSNNNNNSNNNSNYNSNNLAIFNHGYPRFFQFRNSEGQAASGKLSYDQWERLFSPFDGIMGKVLEEEVAGRSAALPYFRRFKETYPDKLTMLHFNGRSRDPRFNSDKYFAGHWLYYNGSIPQSEIPESFEETEIKVPNPNLYQVNMGRYGSSNEDLVICSLNSEGKPDWSRTEQVQLVSIDKVKKTIKVKRGRYSTTPLKFEKGNAYIAAHVTEGPWGKNGNLLWNYNYSLDCPRDKNGKTCSDIFVDEMGGYFKAGGSLDVFDGLEFDVLMADFGNKNINALRNIDTNGDGLADNGYNDGVNRFGLGVYQMLDRLREKLGDNKFLMADGMTTLHQRAFDQMNGIESEGWPALTDMEISDWSGGLNRHLFWSQNARQPVFNYINHKFREGTDENINAPNNINRLVLAVAQMTDAAFTYSNMPESAEKSHIPVWDELVKGQKNETGWLGYPKSPPIRLARSSTDLLGSSGVSMSNSFASSFSGEKVDFEANNNRLKISSQNTSSKSLKFKLEQLKTNGQDLTVFFNISADALKDYPSGIGRALWVTAVSPDGKALGKFMTWMNYKNFEASFYFRNIETTTIDLIFEAEGSEPVYISGFTAHAFPDAIYREFDNGVVLVNPALHPVEFNLGQLFPGVGLRRIQGTAGQDTVTNNGALAGNTVILGERDGLFLAKE